MSGIEWWTIHLSCGCGGMLSKGLPTISSSLAASQRIVVLDSPFDSIYRMLKWNKENLCCSHFSILCTMPPCMAQAFETATCMEPRSVKIIYWLTTLSRKIHHLLRLSLRSRLTTHTSAGVQIFRIGIESLPSLSAEISSYFPFVEVVFPI